MSRKIDALIAEHVMGYTSEWHRGYLGPEHGCNSYTTPCGTISMPIEGLPCYSTDIKAAWEVLEKLDLEEWNWTIYPRCHNQECPSVVLHKFHHSFHIQDQIPMAICLAALKAKEVEVPDE